MRFNDLSNLERAKHWYRANPGGGGLTHPAILDDGNTVAWYDKDEYITKDGSDLVSVWGDKTAYAETEKITNGDFSIDSDWNKDAGWTISGGKANASATTLQIVQPTAVIIGKYYLVEYTISGYVSGSVRAECGNNTGAGTIRSSNGTYSEIILAAGSTDFAFDGIVSFTGSIDNVSVKEIEGNNLYQLTATNQPLWSTDGVLFDGVDNFLKTAAFTLEQPEYLYCVVKQVGWSNFARIFDGNDSGLGYVRQDTSSPNFKAFAGNSSSLNANSVIGSYGIVRCLFNGASSKLIVNETTPVTGNFGSSDMGGFTLAARGDVANYSNIEVKEIIIRKTADSDANSTIIYEYLKSKYSIDDSIPGVLYDGNTVAWFDSALGITKDGSDLVSAWADQSGEDNHLLQATGTNQPLWSSSGVLFDGVDNYMKTAAFTLEQPEFIYMVVKQVSWTVNDYFFDGDGNASGIVQQIGTTPNTVAYAGTLSSQNSNLAVGTYGIIRILLNGASSTFQVNETTQITGNFGANDMGGFTLGGRAAGDFNSNIEVKEIIIRKTSDSANSEASIYAYLSDKYSI